jgi:hypothetical protein
MAFQPKYNSKGKLVEELDTRTLFMSPKPVSPKRQLLSTQGKRKFQDSFETATFDDDRYGQHISSDFFKENIASGYIFYNAKQTSYK